MEVLKEVEVNRVSFTLKDLSEGNIKEITNALKKGELYDSIKKHFPEVKKHSDDRYTDFVCDLHNAWENLKDVVTKPLFKQIISNHFTIKDYTIHLELQSAVEANNIDTYLPELMKYLRDELSDDSIQLKYEVVAPKKTKWMSYSDIFESFNEFKKLSPLLNDSNIKEAVESSNIIFDGSQFHAFVSKDVGKDLVDIFLHAFAKQTPLDINPKSFYYAKDTEIALAYYKSLPELMIDLHNSYISFDDLAKEHKIKKGELMHIETTVCMRSYRSGEMDAIFNRLTSVFYDYKATHKRGDLNSFFAFAKSHNKFKLLPSGEQISDSDLMTYVGRFLVKHCFRLGYTYINARHSRGDLWFVFDNN